VRQPPPIVAAIALMAAALAQQAPQEGGGLRYSIEQARIYGVDRGDYREELLFGGFRFLIPDLQLEVRGNHALLLADLEAAHALLDRPSASGLPRRGIELPAPRRRLSAQELRERFERTMRAMGSTQGLPQTPAAERALDLLRYLYFEGGVTVVRAGVEVIRCDRLWISPVDDRIVVENVELRYIRDGGKGRTSVVVRGPKLTKTGSRWVGRDLTITSCTAGEPHVALAVGEAEIRELEGELEILTRGQTLQIGGTDVLPLPDGHFFTGSQSQFPVRRASAGYSGTEGLEAKVVLGLPWNDTGGALHEWLTGRPANEFRGDWELGVGWVEKRGVPLTGALDYRAEGLYRGRTEAFALDDSGENIREIQTHFDGAPIDNTSRGLVRSENRFYSGKNTHLDLTVFHATDPAVLSEFFGGDYRGSELPETSAYLHHAAGNHLFTVGARSNLDEFSYRDNRSLAERFVEELPVATWHWIAQPIGETPWETPIVLDMATELGQRRSDFDDRATTRVSDRTFRADQLVELSAPFHWGHLNLRPYVSGHGTFYDHAADEESEGRIAFEAGLQVGTRLSRSFLWTDEDGAQVVRHVIAPRLTIANRFHVDDQAAEFRQFDSTDELTEQNLVRFEVRNLLQRMEPGDGARDVVMLDLAQDLWPEANRDNGGDELGLLYYDLLLRPRAPWMPFPTVVFALYGDHDWQDGMRTLDTELQFGPLAGITWTVQYRTDEAVDGAVGLSGSTRLLERWDLYASSLYDLQTDDYTSYGFGLRRNDHDWSIALSGDYNPYTDETSVRLEFVPRLPGTPSGRQDQFGGSHLHDSGFATQY